MKTIKLIKLSPAKTARVQENGGLITITIMQGDGFGGYEVLQMKNFKKQKNAVKWALAWK